MRIGATPQPQEHRKDKDLEEFWGRQVDAYITRVTSYDSNGMSKCDVLQKLLSDIKSNTLNTPFSNLGRRENQNAKGVLKKIVQDKMFTLSISGIEEAMSELSK